MNPAAVRDFIQITHERYGKWLREEFGKTIPAMFTDEPQMKQKRPLKRAGVPEDVALSYTPDFEPS